MKQTIFIYTKNHEETSHKIDFIYEPPANGEVKIMFDGIDGTYKIKWIVDEFTGNPNVQIRSIRLE